MKFDKDKDKARSRMGTQLRLPSILLVTSLSECSTLMFVWLDSLRGSRLICRCLVGFVVGLELALIFEFVEKVTFRVKVQKTTFLDLKVERFGVCEVVKG